MTTKTKVILGIFGAPAAGTAIGMLLAPEKGTEIRGRIKRTAGDWADHLTDLFANAKGEIETLKGKVSKGAGSAANKAGNEFNNVKESYS